MKRTTLGLAIAGVIALVATVDASIISVNFTEDVTRSNHFIPAATTAGLAGSVAANWNNVGTAPSPQAGTAGSLVDSDGTTTGASITWSSPNVWGDGTADLTGDGMLARGYIDDGGTGINISLTGHGYSEYNVVVYFSTDHITGTDPYAPITINGTSVQTTGARLSYVSAPGWDATDTVTLTGQTAATMNLTALRNGDERASIAGIQIVQIPEPATLGMVAVFGGGLLFIRRKLMA